MMQSNTHPNGFVQKKDWIDKAYDEYKLPLKQKIFKKKFRKIIENNIPKISNTELISLQEVPYNLYLDNHFEKEPIYCIEVRDIIELLKTKGLYIEYLSIKDIDKKYFGELFIEDFTEKEIKLLEKRPESLKKIKKDVEALLENKHQPKAYEQGLEDGRKEVLSKVEELIENGKYINIFPDAIQYMKRIITRTKEILLPKNETDERK